MFLQVDFSICYFLGLPHPRGQRNNARYGLLTWATIRVDTDGYAQIEPLTRIVNIHETSIVTHLMLDVNLDGSLYKPPTTRMQSSSLNTKDIRITSTNKAIKKTTTMKPS
jgi:hypothetical protein